jgi:hypothetical protein
VPSWRESVDRTLALTNDCMKEGTAALDSVWRVQRASLDLDAIALTLRTLQGVEADCASAQGDLRARLAADCTGGTHDERGAARPAQQRAESRRADKCDAGGQYYLNHRTEAVMCVDINVPMPKGVSQLCDARGGGVLRGGTPPPGKPPPGWLRACANV